MNTQRLALAVTIALLCAPFERARAADPVAPPDEHSTAINTAMVPITKLEENGYDWMKRHNDVLALNKKTNPQVILIGDSITHIWGGEPFFPQARGTTSWKEAFDGLRVSNLGFGWDRTQNVLWRLDHGEIDGINPKWAVILIGTNNINGTPAARGNTPQEIVDAIMAICDRVRVKCPATHIILMAVFSRGSSPADPIRAKIVVINNVLAKAVAAHPEITYLDIGSQFLAPDGSIPGDIMPDGVHPTDKGFQIWAKALIAAGIRD